MDKMDISKGELAKLIGITDKTFDYALPQQWLDGFIEKMGLDYGLVLGTTFSVYDPHLKMVSGCEEVQNAIDNY